MRNIKAIAVDDEPLALDVIETYIEQIPEIDLIAKCKNEDLKRPVTIRNHFNLVTRATFLKPALFITVIRSMTFP